MTRPSLGSTFELDRQSERRGDAAYLQGLIEGPQTRYLVLVEGRPVLTRPPDGAAVEVGWFTAAEFADCGFDPAAALFLGVNPANGTAVFALSGDIKMLRSFQRSPEARLSADDDLRKLATAGALPEGDIALIGLAKSLAHWHDNSRCCGRCGGATRPLDGGWKRRCRACGREHFPRLDPVVIMLVIHPDGGRCLLSHETRFRENMFSALAGYVEPGEDIEHAVRREVLEETRVKVGDVRFHASQPWPFPHTLMIGCVAQGLSEEIVPDATEIEEARWFTRSEALDMLAGRHAGGLFVPGRQAIAHTLIRHFAEGGGV
ncbi:MAG: hypothetical protein RLZ98_456 [Pseudomonadota bacterium]|jgi:NAD+ diphosphatase